MNILCTNDDGYLATGIRVLASAASAFGAVTTVAPDREQSATSHSLTLHHPLRARRAVDGTWIVDGTPTDCVLLALSELLPEGPDVCVSGVNHGPNMGEDVLYSGTVAAAMEATVMGIPAIAFSYTGTYHEELEGWQGVIRAILEGILGKGRDASGYAVQRQPAGDGARDVKGIRVTSLGKRRYAGSITRANDPSGRPVLLDRGRRRELAGRPGLRLPGGEDGYVSVTPLHLDLTNYELLEEIRAWDLTL
jgi:5'-nucleotidase